jgi:hypothetical protein
LKGGNGLMPIYLPPKGDGVDITNLLMLIIDDYPDVFLMRYDNEEKLFG